MGDTRDTTQIGYVARDLQAPKEASLVQIYGPDLGQRFALDRPQIGIGRDADNEMILDNENVSRHHARLFAGDTVFLEDLGSTNGTLVNDQQIKRQELKNGDIIKIGPVVLKFITGGNAEGLYYEEIYRMTIQDGLTGIPNRRHFEDFLEREFARAKRYERPLILAMFDIDHFKKINDTYGHLAGDYVLRRLASVTKTTIRREELLARYGGEEFGVIMPESSMEKASAYGEKIRSTIEQTPFTYDEAKITVTISMGIAEVTAAMVDHPALIRAADAALYKAKSEGRNRVKTG